MKSGVTPARYSKDGLVLSDGTELKADLIVYYTGFAPDMLTVVGSIVGPEIGDQLYKIGGVDPEGEPRVFFRYPGRKLLSPEDGQLSFELAPLSLADYELWIDPALWFTAGGIATSLGSPVLEDFISSQS